MGTAKILIVEDEPNMVAGLRDNFEYEGFQVLMALDGVEGLERGVDSIGDASLRISFNSRSSVG